MLEVRDLHKSYGAKPILEHISFQLYSGESICVLGPSGCGKTTLLQLICGLQPADQGQIALNQQPVEHPSPDIALILQNYGLLPWKTNLQNVALGLKIQGVSRKERKERARKTLAEVGLAGRENDYPSVLSGGEQQRVAIARAYTANPKLMLMDEPFSSLDAITREKLQVTLLKTWLEAAVPYLLVTHSVEEAVYLGKRILILSGSPATITAVIENPGFGLIDYRKSPEFYERVRTIRDQIGESW